MTKHTTMMTEETQLVPNSSQNSNDESSLLMQKKHRLLGAVVVLCITFFGVSLRVDDGGTTGIKFGSDLGRQLRKGRTGRRAVL